MAFREKKKPESSSFDLDAPVSVSNSLNYQKPQISVASPFTSLQFSQTICACFYYSRFHIPWNNPWSNVCL